jgi:hypothetical protein
MPDLFYKSIKSFSCKLKNILKINKLYRFKYTKKCLSYTLLKVLNY